MKLEEMVLRGAEIVNDLAEAIEDRGIGLKEVEERILDYVNQIGAGQISASAKLYFALHCTAHETSTRD